MPTRERTRLSSILTDFTLSLTSGGGDEMRPRQAILTLPEAPLPQWVGNTIISTTSQHLWRL